MPKKYATSFDFDSEIVWIKDAESYSSSTAALNAKVPPEGVPAAKGDGTVDDTNAIQGLIDYAKTSLIKTIFLPPGSYSVRSLTMASGVSIVGIDPYNTKLVLRGGATNPLLSGSIQNITISGITLDGNSGAQTENVSTVVITSGNDVTIRNAIIGGGYVNLSYIGAGGSLVIDDVMFPDAVYKHLLISGDADVRADNLIFGDLSRLSANCCMDISVDYGIFRFTSNATTPVCIRCAGTGNRFEGFIHNAVDNVVDTGTDNDYIIYGQSQTETLSGDRKLTAANIMEQISGDKTVNAGDISENATNKTTHTTQDMTEQIDGTKNVTAGNITEQINGKKTETVTGGYIGKFGTASFEAGVPTWPVKFPDKTVNLYDIGKNISSFVNVLDFGAKGDGTTDDTEAFKNAIEHCITNNVGLYVPAVGNWNQEGGYILSATLNIDYPMSFVCAPNVLLNWKNAHLNTSAGTTDGRNGATKYESGFGINIDYGTYRGHKGYYSFGIIQGDKSYTYPGGSAPSGHYWTGIRVANGDLIDLNIRYISYWDRGILVTSDKDYTANNRINLLVCDDCQTGITFSPANNNAIDVTEFYFNTIGICKYGIVFESDGENSSSFSRTNSLRIRGSQIYTEYKNGACLYNTAAFEEAVVNADIDIMCLFNNRTGQTTLKTGDSSTWYGKCVTGTQTISGNNDTFGAHDSRFSIGVYNGPMTAGQPININIGGWGNEIINKWQKFHGTAATPALLVMTPSEASFNGGIGGCLPGRTAFVSWTTDKSYAANETVTLYAYAMCLTASGVTPMNIMEVENYGLFDAIIKSDTYSAARQFFITLKFRTEVAQGYKFDFLVTINDIN